jgi:ATP-dependent RNA helicase DOB1
MGSLKRKTPEEPSTTTSEIQHECVHHVSYPHGYVQASSSTSVSDSSQTKEPAKKFPFTLDPFQSQAITCLENSESVMVIQIKPSIYFHYYYYYYRD